MIRHVTLGPRLVEVVSNNDDSSFMARKKSEMCPSIFNIEEIHCKTTENVATSGRLVLHPFKKILSPSRTKTE